MLNDVPVLSDGPHVLENDPVAPVLPMVLVRPSSALVLTQLAVSEPSQALPSISEAPTTTILGLFHPTTEDTS